MDTFGERLRYVIDKKNITPYRIAIDLNIGKSTISNYLKNTTKADSSKLDLICRYLNINKQWLLNGIGDISLDSNKCEVIDEPINHSGNPDLIQYLEKELEKKDQKIAELNQEIGCLRATIKQWEKISICDDDENKKEAI